MPESTPKNKALCFASNLFYFTKGYVLTTYFIFIFKKLNLVPNLVTPQIQKPET